MVMSALLELFTECQLRRVNRGFINVLPSKSACTGSQFLFFTVMITFKNWKEYMYKCTSIFYHMQRTT